VPDSDSGCFFVQEYFLSSAAIMLSDMHASPSFFPPNGGYIVENFVYPRALPGPDFFVFGKRE